MSALLKGDRIAYFGNYISYGEVGRGAMGWVHRARQLSTGRTVALKLLLPNLLTNEAALLRLRAETEAVAKLNHPNIAPIIEAGEHDGQLYLAMPFIEGESLAERIARLGPNPDEKNAATLVAKISRAVHHAHQRGVLHRDLKPGNVLVDEAGEPHLIDFGLAKCVEQELGLTQTGAFMGTPAYASPEQAAGKNESVTTATDVYSLGAILFALLTGKPPFTGASTAETISQVVSSVPPKPCALRPQLSSDLETICLKCLEKEPQQRYTSAVELADELERFLAGEPIQARPTGKARRAWMWGRRNPIHAALGATACLTLISLLAGLGIWFRKERLINDQIQLRLFAQQLQNSRLIQKNAGWSRQAWGIAVKAAQIPTALQSGEIKDEAVATLAGLDAYRVDSITNYGAKSVIWNQDGTRLLIGGGRGSNQIWDATSNTVQAAPQSSSDFLAFSEAGAACYLEYAGKRHSLVLVDSRDSKVVREWVATDESSHREFLQQPPVRVGLGDSGRSGAAVFSAGDGRAAIALFSKGTIRILQVLTNQITALTVSRDGNVVAAADAEGIVRAWTICDSKKLAEFKTSRNKVLSLALSRYARTNSDGKEGSDGRWLLAVGADGGEIHIWDTGNLLMPMSCQGGHYLVSALAFSPDGVTLASGGFGPVKLWDVASGRLLLNISKFQSGEETTGLEFSPDGKNLAVSCINGNPHSWHATVWQLEFDRGIITLRGFSGQISKVCFSPDGRKVAALSHRWEIGIWDLTAQKLVRIIEAPPGQTADNATLAFSPDSRHLGFSAWQNARLWDVESGATLGTWTLPKALCDMLSFPAAGELLLFRWELPEFEGVTNQDHGCRILNLLSGGATNSFSEIRSFAGHPRDVTTVLHGRAFLVDDFSRAHGTNSTQLRCFEGSTGRELWTIPTARDRENSGLVADAAGEFVSCRTKGNLEASILDASSSKILTTLPFEPSAIKMKPKLYATSAFMVNPRFGLSLLESEQESPFVSLCTDVNPPRFLRFSPNENLLAWGNEDGSVTVCDLPTITSKLAKLAEH